MENITEKNKNKNKNIHGKILDAIDEIGKLKKEINKIKNTAIGVLDKAINDQEKNTQNQQNQQQRQQPIQQPIQQQQPQMQQQTTETKGEPQNQQEIKNKLDGQCKILTGVGNEEHKYIEKLGEEFVDKTSKFTTNINNHDYKNMGIIDTYKQAYINHAISYESGKLRVLSILFFSIICIFFIAYIFFICDLEINNTNNDNNINKINNNKNIIVLSALIVILILKLMS